MFKPTTRVAVVQTVILLAVSALAYAVWSEKTALSAAYGVVVALFGTLLLLVRERESEAHTEWSAQKHLGVFYRLGVEKMILTIILLALGFLSGKLDAATMVGAFICGQAAWLTVVFHK